MVGNLQEIEAQAREAGFSMGEVLAQANVAQTTWARWRHGHNAPNLRTWQRIESALSELRRRRIDVLMQREGVA